MTAQSRDMLKAQAKDMGISFTEAKVLGNDPFFTGTDEEYTYARWAAKAWDTMMASRQARIHLRGFHYWLQSMHYKWPTGELYAQGRDPFKEWQSLLWGCQVARYLGIGEWKNLVDFKHPNPDDYCEYEDNQGLTQYDKPVPDIVREKLEGLVEDILNAVTTYAPWYDDKGFQTYHTEVWVEKESMGEFIQPITRRLHATYQPLVGQSSVEKVTLCYQRCIRAAEHGQRVRIFYISDWDRYGHQMPAAVARKLEFYARMMGERRDLDIKLQHLALNEAQIHQFNLPPAPKHGEMVVELDALEAIHPGELANIVRQALEPYYDGEKARVVRRENDRIAEQVREMVEQLRPQLKETLEGLQVDDLAELDLNGTIDPDFNLPTRDLEVKESNGDTWLLDTSREYWEQYRVYREQKVSREEQPG